MGLYHKSEEPSLYYRASSLLLDRVRKGQFLPENYIYAACLALPESSRFTEHGEHINSALACTSSNLQACSSSLRGIPAKGHGWKQAAITRSFLCLAWGGKLQASLRAWLQQRHYLPPLPKAPRLVGGGCTLAAW